MSWPRSHLPIVGLVLALHFVSVPLPASAGKATAVEPVTTSDLGTVPHPAAVEASTSIVLSFSDAAMMLRKGHPQLKAAAETQRRSAELKAAAKGLRLPHFQGTAKWTRIDEPIVIDLEPIRTAMLALHPAVPAAQVPPFATDIQDDHFFKAQIEMTWPVYTGGKITAANRAADARLEDARQQSRRTEQHLFTELVHRYYGLRLAEQVRAVRQQVLTSTEQHLFQATRLEEEGMIARAERLHAEVAQAEARRQFKAASQDLALAKTALSSLLGCEDGLRPTDTLFVLHTLPPLDELQERALESNPDLRRLVAQRELAQQATRVERAAYLPDVALFAVRELAPDDLTILEPRWAAGVGVKLNIFDGFSRGHRVAAARATENSLSHLEQAARNDIALLAENHYRRLRKAVEQFDSTTATIALAEENLRVRVRAFEEGFATSLDVVDARTTLASARLIRLNSAYEFVTALADLLATTGQSSDFERFQLLADVKVNP